MMFEKNRVYEFSLLKASQKVKSVSVLMVFTLFLSLFAGMPQVAAAETAKSMDNGVKITVLATSDLHGNIFPWDYNSAKAANQGLAKISTYVNQVRTENPNVVLVDNGDTVQGTPLSYYYDKIDTKSEYPMATVMGAMGYDTWTLGNHEYNYGLDVLNRIMADMKKENIRVLSGNTYQADGTNFVEPYSIKTFQTSEGEVKVGIIGLTTKTIPAWEDKAHYAGLQFNDLVSEAKKWVPKAKEAGADIVVVTMHSGEESASDTIPENQVKAVATDVDGIDAIVAGHMHKVIGQDSFTNPSGKTVIVTEPGRWGQHVSQIDFMLSKDAVGHWVLEKASKTVPMDDSITADPEILKLAQPYQDATLAYVATKIGTATGDFLGDGQTVKETALMDLINKVQKHYAQTDLSIAAPLSPTAKILKGDITIQDLMGVYVYENFLYGIKMSGKQLKDWMEWSARYYQQVSASTASITKDKVLNVPDYNLDQLYGATYTVDLTQPAGQRIKNLKVNGTPVQDSDVFTVAINNYRFNGGGGFMKAAGISNPEVTFDSAKAYGDDGQVRNLMIKYIQEVSSITPTVANNWALSTTSVAAEGSAGIVKLKVIASALNLRNGPGLGYKVLGSVAQGTIFELIDSTDGWDQVRYNGQTYYVFAKYAEPAAGSVLKTATVSARIGLNVRAKGDLSAPVLGALPYGTTVYVVGTEGEWHKIIYQGAYAYVYAKYAG